MYKSMEEKINQNYESAEFCEINGRILRSLNVLNDKKIKKAVCSEAEGS